MPEASVIASEATVPGLEAVRVLLHAASRTGGFGGGGGGGGRHALATAATITAANPTATLRTRGEPTQVPDWRPHDTATSRGTNDDRGTDSVDAVAERSVDDGRPHRGVV